MRLRLSLVAILAMACQAIPARAQHTHILPPSYRLMHPGPGVTGPGPGVLAPSLPSLPQAVVPMSQTTVQILFAKPTGMHVQWDVSGSRTFSDTPLVVPGRQNFRQAGIYQLKISHLEGRPGVELYPTIEIGPVTPRTEAYLAHNAIPIQFTEEDLDQVQAGNFVTKVIYLPDPEFQEMALAGVETLVSTRLDPGVDPIIEADRRGSIMAIVRIGNKDIEMNGGGQAPSRVAPASYQNGAVMSDRAMPAAAGALPAPAPGPMGGIPPNYISGLTAPQWGMPYSGTPIGLVGPPHLPFGAPAGLQKHVMRNHTVMHLPQPVRKFKIHVKQQPGLSYPKPVSRVHIREQTIYPPQRYGQPYYDRVQPVK